MNTSNFKDPAHLAKKDFIYNRLVRHGLTIEDLAIKKYPNSLSKQETYLNNIKQFIRQSFHYEFYRYHCIKTIRKNDHFRNITNTSEIERTISNY